MRLLVVTNQFPLPLDSGGPLRFDGLARALAASHDVHMLALARPTTTPALVERMQATASEARSRYSRPPRPAGSRSAWGRALATGSRPTSGLSTARSCATRLRALAAECDAVVFLDDYAAGYGAVVGDPRRW